MGEVVTVARGASRLGRNQLRDTVKLMREKAPLQPLIAAIEQVRDGCYLCDRAPLEDMLGDLRRWASQLEPPESESATVLERPRAASR